MPYELKKVGANQYYVQNKETKRKYSLHPLSLSQAQKQLKSLQIQAPK